MLNQCAKNRNVQKRNRRRSQRRTILCPTPACYLESVSQRYSWYTEDVGQLQQRGLSKRNATITLVRLDDGIFDR